MGCITEKINGSTSSLAESKVIELEFTYCEGDGGGVSIKSPADIEEAELFKKRLATLIGGWMYEMENEMAAMDRDKNDAGTMDQVQNILSSGRFTPKLAALFDSGIEGKKLVPDGRLAKAARINGDHGAIDSLDELFQLSNPLELDGEAKVVTELAVSISGLKYTGNVKADAEALKNVYNIVHAIFIATANPIKSMGDFQKEFCAYYLKQIDKKLQAFSNSQNERIKNAANMLIELGKECVKQLVPESQIDLEFGGILKTF